MVAVADIWQIIATAIPKITDEFPGSIQDVGWYGSAYLLTVSLALSDID